MNKMATPILSKITMTTRMELEPCKKREKREFSKVLRRVFKLTLTKIFICELHLDFKRVACTALKCWYQ